MRARELFAPVRTIFETLRSIVPPNAYYRYNHDYTSMMIIIVGASLSVQHTDLHTAGFVTRTHK